MLTEDEELALLLLLLLLLHRWLFQAKRHKCFNEGQSLINGRIKTTSECTCPLLSNQNWFFFFQNNKKKGQKLKTHIVKMSRPNLSIK
jgi:hypothetical protein